VVLYSLSASFIMNVILLLLLFVSNHCLNFIVPPCLSFVRLILT
jgi:hypothetical protein